MPKKQIMYIPILVDSSDEVDLTYVMCIGLSAWKDADHLSGALLRVEAIREEEIIQSGIAKYRDSLIPKYVHEDLSTGKCKKIILDYSTEGYYDIEWDYVSTLFGVEKSKIIWVTGIYNPKFLDDNNEVTVVFDNFWERFLHITINRNLPNSLESILFSYLPHFKYFLMKDEIRPIETCPVIRGVNQQVQDIEDLKIRKYHGLSYNRQPHLHRLYLLTKLKTEGLIDSTAYSWGGLGAYWRDHWKDPANIASQLKVAKDTGYLNKFDDVSFREIVKSKQIVFPGEELDTNKADSINFDHIKDCYFQIISETMVINAKQSANGIVPTPFLSEKSYKPFISGMPFVMWGQMGTVQALRGQKYNCYDNWINHEYDSIIDNGERFEALMTEVKRLYAIPPKQWSIMLKEMLPIIKYNIEQFNRNAITFRLSTNFGEFTYIFDKEGQMHRQTIVSPDVLSSC
jgi:hypothetical protein